MTRIILLLAALLLTFPLNPAVAGDAPLPQKRAAASDKEDYEQSMKERLGRLGAQLDELKKKADSRSDRAEKQLKNHLAEAEKRRQEAARKLAELERASRDSWRTFSADMDQAVKEFERSYERAVKHRE